jgi:hypothetical protein
VNYPEAVLLVLIINAPTGLSTLLTALSAVMSADAMVSFSACTHTHTRLKWH